MSFAVCMLSWLVRAMHRSCREVYREKEQQGRGGGGARVGGARRKTVHKEMGGTKHRGQHEPAAETFYPVRTLSVDS